MKTFATPRFLGALAAVLLFMCVAGIAGAQTLVLTATPTSADVRATPTLTWSGVPANATCAVTGGWSGTKAASGSELQAEIMRTTRYAMNCSWPAVSGTVGKALISWTPPITNTDGSQLTDLAGYKIVYGTSATALTQSVSVPVPAATSFTVDNLTAGTWSFAVRALNSTGVESGNSNVTTKTVTATGGSPAGFSSAYVDVVIHPAPMPPTIVTVAIVSTQQVAPLYRVLGKAGAYYPGEMFGMVEAGRACEAAQVFKYRGASFHRVSVTSDDVWPKTASTANLAAPCA
jgi:hypothetical protein